MSYYFPTPLGGPVKEPKKWKLFSEMSQTKKLAARERRRVAKLRKKQGR